MPKTYPANCHCGLIKFSVTLDDALAPEGNGDIGNCNCSICTKNGYLLVYPLRKNVKFEGDCFNKMKSYFFGKKNKPHMFCPECGSSILIDFKDSDDVSRRTWMAVNTRMFKDINYEGAIFDSFDGMKELQPPYEV